MNRRNVENYKMLTRVVDFTTRNVGLFPKNSAAAEILKTLESGVEKLTRASAAYRSEEASIRDASIARSTARKDLRNLISRASLVSRALHSEKVRSPRKDSEHELIAIGRGFANDAEALKKDFVRHALPPDDVLAAVEALEGAILNHTTARTARSATLTEWSEAMAETMDALIGLDAIVANTLAGNPAALASYQLVRSIPHTRGRNVAAKTPAAPAPEPPAVPATPNAAAA